MKGCRRVLRKVGNWLEHKNNGEWLKDMRGMLSLVATVIATMTFQSALNPPGGVWPTKEGLVETCSSYKQVFPNPCPGEAVLAFIKPDNYAVFLFFNTLCLVSSLALCLLLVSGLPLNNRFFTWLFSIGMCITLTSLTLTYWFAAEMTTPHPVLSATSNMFIVVLYIWILLIGLLTLFLCLRLFVWIVTKCINRCKP
uniref:PGG domain-containing protein n=2 Tax=Cajanus cajan TaxID=3821 RepID=A0A151T9C2_CAJCA|nr:hypothetical protein KK1_018239 [Cajanus cajan]